MSVSADPPRSRCGMIALLLVLLGELACLLVAVRFGDLGVAGHPGRLVGALLAAGVCFLVAVRLFAKAPAAGRAVLFWLVAIVLRVAVLPMEPGDDFWRYLWEGRIQQHGFNPYVESPDSPRLVALRDEGWGKINHPQSAAIYPPATELVFAALARVVAATAQSPGSVLLFKVVFLLADLATAALLLRLIGGADRHRLAAWYAWNPAVVFAGAGAAHFDSLMLATLTAAVFALHRATGVDAARPAWSWALASAACLGLAIACKLIPVFLLPVWLLALRRRAAVLLLSVGIPAVLTLPYGGPGVVLRPLLAFTRITRFNDLVWGWIEAVAVRNPYGRNWPFTLVLVLAVVVIVWKFRADWRRSALWVLGAALLLSPVVHPWYLTWILPLAVWRGQIAWTVLSLSGITALLLWETTSLWTAWQPNFLTRSLVVLPPLVGWFLQLKTQNRESKIA